MVSSIARACDMAAFFAPYYARCAFMYLASAASASMIGPWNSSCSPLR
jgi:hypothetical protein